MFDILGWVKIFSWLQACSPWLHANYIYTLAGPCESPNYWPTTYRSMVKGGREAGIAL